MATLNIGADALRVFMPTKGWTGEYTHAELHPDGYVHAPHKSGDPGFTARWSLKQAEVYVQDGYWLELKNLGATHVR